MVSCYGVQAPAINIQVRDTASAQDKPSTGSLYWYCIFPDIIIVVEAEEESSPKLRIPVEDVVAIETAPVTCKPFVGATLLISFPIEALPFTLRVEEANPLVGSVFIPTPPAHQNRVFVFAAFHLAPKIPKPELSEPA